jgi:hypothetical protein
MDRRQVERVLDGIDPTKPVYLETLWPGEKVVQFRDRPSVSHPSGDVGGQWFALPSVGAATMGSLGIGSGLAGRVRHVLTVVRAVEVLESTAAAMRGHPTERYVGPGGATQIFVPDRGLSALA